MESTADWVVVGRFGRVHGIKGDITVHSYTEPCDNLLRYTDWHAFIDGQWQPLKGLHVNVTDKHILAQIDGLHEREEVARLTNVAIGVSRSQLPQLPKDEFYWHQLIGMQVINQQGDVLGQVTEILATGSNDVLVVEGSRRQLIPWLLGDSILHVSNEQKTITVEWDADF